MTILNIRVASRLSISAIQGKVLQDFPAPFLFLAVSFGKEAKEY